MNPDEQTLRDRLLARHTGAGIHLDALRRRALPPRLPTTGSVRESIRAFFYPHRIAWCVLGLTWLGLLGFQIALPRPPAPSPASKKIPPAAVAVWLTTLNNHGSLAQIDPNR
jgi:hypothetical protein